MSAPSEFEILETVLDQNLLNGEIVKWPTTADCKSAPYGFEGSTPSLTTINEAAGVTQWLEFLPSKQAVASSNLVSRSIETYKFLEAEV